MPLRLGLIGTGNIGRTHLAALSSLKSAELANISVVAVSDIDSASMKKAARDFNVPDMFENSKDLINSRKIDVVYICTPTRNHMDLVEAATAAGKAIFCEGPLANSCPQARNLLGMTLDADVPSGAGLILRYEPFILYAKDLVTKHDFGRPMLAHIRAEHQLSNHTNNMNGWGNDTQIAGGGTLLEHCIHDIDVLTWFFGDVESVFAKVGFFTGNDSEDLASLMIMHKDGAVSTLDSIWHPVDRPDERRIEFFFENGFISIKLESGDRYLEYQLKGGNPVRVHSETVDMDLLRHLGVQIDNGSLETYGVLVDSSDNMYAAMNYSFLNSIRNGLDPSPNFKDAVAVHRIIDAAYESANNETPVDIL